MRIFLLHILLSIFTIVPAQSECDFYAAYCKQDLALTKFYLEKMDTLFSKSRTYDNLFRLAKARYLCAAMLLDKQKNDEAGLMLDKLLSALNGLEKSEKYATVAYALKSANYAFYIGIDMTTAITNGIKSKSFVEKALEQDSLNPYAQTEYGHVKYHVPAFLGGSLTKAIEHYTKSIAIFETANEDLSCNWYYINTLLFLAKAYEANENTARAIEIFDKISLLAPEFEKISDWKSRIVDFPEDQ